MLGLREAPGCRSLRGSSVLPNMMAFDLFNPLAWVSTSLVYRTGCGRFSCRNGNSFCLTPVLPFIVRKYGWVVAMSVYYSADSRRHSFRSSGKSVRGLRTSRESSGSTGKPSIAHLPSFSFIICKTLQFFQEANRLNLNVKRSMCC